MNERSETRTIEVPAAVAHLITINVAYEVVLCVGAGCRKVVSLASAVEHLRRFHKTPAQGAQAGAGAHPERAVGVRL